MLLAVEVATFFIAMYKGQPIREWVKYSLFIHEKWQSQYPSKNPENKRLSQRILRNLAELQCLLYQHQIFIAQYVKLTFCGPQQAIWHKIKHGMINSVWLTKCWLFLSADLPARDNKTHHWDELPRLVTTKPITGMSSPGWWQQNPSLGWAPQAGDGKTHHWDELPRLVTTKPITGMSSPDWWQQNPSLGWAPQAGDGKTHHWDELPRLVTTKPITGMSSPDWWQQNPSLGWAPQAGDGKTHHWDELPRLVMAKPVS